MEPVVIAGIDEALEFCGVSAATLTNSEKGALDDAGYLVLAGVMGDDWLGRLRAAFEAALGSGQEPGSGKRTGTRHSEDLIAADEAFDDVCLQGRVLAAVHHVLRRPFRVLQLSGRDPLPGYGQQGLHTDWLPRSPAEPFSVVTTLWLLDDFESSNGATRLVPGSHRSPKQLPKSMQAPQARHPDETRVAASAGAVIVFNGHLWHSGTRNESPRPRRVLQCQFVAMDAAPPAAGPMRSAGHLSPLARYLLGA